MDKQVRKLIVEARDVERRLWDALMARLPLMERNILQAHEALSLCVKMLAGELETGPNYCEVDMRECLKEQVELYQRMLDFDWWTEPASA